ncbi:glycosyltransferase family 1 protein [Stenotrophomonas maltophilia]|nr:glycosyltransferase [Stenotrophomonas maltophilia]MCF3498953.1 glycosyltransferase [Stenotrophomonas maltophilia]MCI1120167.1 glycosyltransferase [Stenotrophomonas maltophilia]RRU08366.1 glycosyltransferase family 1 protein [Stenotrophomonas maltophilia]RRU12668.1 glycosyltransferase family 1 protein [Stenotrophomonas maltophilia]
MNTPDLSSIKVLMITARADHGGGPRHLELLMRDGADWIMPYVACPDDKPYWARFNEIAGGRMFRIPHRKFDFRQAWRLARYARREGIDIVHAHGKGAGLYARFISAVARIPGIHTAHGIHVGEYGRISRKLYSIYENVSSLWVNHVIHVSDEERAQAQMMGLWRKRPSTVIPNGVTSHEPSEINDMRNRARRKLGVQDSKPIVVTVSRFDYQKNMPEAYAIAKALPEMHFIWIGAGADSPRLEERATSEGVCNIRFLGQVDSPLDCLAAADVYLSTSRWEGLPLAVLEAMSLGIPSVLSNVTGHVELVRTHGVGLLYSLGDVESASEALQRVAYGESLRNELSKQALRSQTREFSSKAVATETATIYKKVLKA